MRSLPLRSLALSATIGGLLSLPFWLGAVAVPHTFSNGDTADANQVNANFLAVTNVLNGQSGALQLGTDATACSDANEGQIRYNDATYMAEVCNGDDRWVELGGGRNYRYYRLTLDSNDDGDAGPHNYLGGFTVFTALNGGGTNLGALAGVGAYSIGANAVYDPALSLAYANLNGGAGNDGGRIRNAVAGTFANTWVQIDVGDGAPAVQSWGFVSRPNHDPGHWNDMTLSASHDGVSFDVLSVLTNQVLGQRQTVITDL